MIETSIIFGCHIVAHHADDVQWIDQIVLQNPD